MTTHFAIEDGSHEQGLHRTIICVSEMARQLSLSRSQFYNLMLSGIFPEPSRREGDAQPFFTPEQQFVCLEVRRRGVGANGKMVRFYRRRKRPNSIPERGRSSAKRPIPPAYRPIVAGVRSLGAVDVRQAQILEVIEELFPNGVGEASLSAVIRLVFLQLRRFTSVSCPK